MDLKVCPRGHEALKDLPRGGCIAPNLMVTDCTVCGDRYNDFVGYWTSHYGPVSVEEAGKLLSAEYRHFPFRFAGQEAAELSIRITRLISRQVHSEQVSFPIAGDETQILRELAAWAPVDAEVSGLDQPQGWVTYRWAKGGRDYELVYQRSHPQKRISFSWQPQQP